MNKYKINVIFHNKNKSDNIFSFQIKCQNKQEALQSLIRNDVQSVIKSMIPSLLEFKNKFEIQILFNDKVAYTVSDLITNYS